MLPPQCVAGGRLSSSWAGCGATGVAGGVAATTTAASRSRGAVGASWAGGTEGG